MIGHPQNKGDDVSLHFEGTSVEAGDGEQIRISLRQFNMFLRHPPNSDSAHDGHTHSFR